MNAPKKVIQAQLLLLREDSHRKLFIRIITPGTICTMENAVLIYCSFSTQYLRWRIFHFWTQKTFSVSLLDSKYFILPMYQLHKTLS